MESLPITPEDEDLIARAREIIDRLFVPGRHHVGAAVRTASGRVYAAVHLEANVGRIAVCAEAVALGKAISEGERAFDTVVAVLRTDDAPDPPRVVSPCGMCRELISDYGPETRVIYADGDRLLKAPVLALLPAKFA